jgi:hypothetical protein
MDTAKVPVLLPAMTLGRTALPRGSPAFAYASAKATSKIKLLKGIQSK